jgi:hypothetical protein
MPDCFKYAEYYHEPLLKDFGLYSAKTDKVLCNSLDVQSSARVSWVSAAVKFFKHTTNTQ